jgi:uncharacterized protein YecE (DUF72 family)
MSATRQIRVGLAGWSNPPALRLKRRDGQSHLLFYAEHFGCVEINSSFYRAHQRETYARWHDETPKNFRFSVKMPRSITHENHLKKSTRELERFCNDIAALRTKLATILVQLPPALDFNRRTARTFFEAVPRRRGITVVCEPRHPSWFTPAADEVLHHAGIARVGADPARFGGAELPGGAGQLAYFRWHGSPRLYYSTYSRQKLEEFATSVHECKAKAIWCIFDNTASHAAWDDALAFSQLLGRPVSAR